MKKIGVALRVFVSVLFVCFDTSACLTQVAGWLVIRLMANDCLAYGCHGKWWVSVGSVMQAAAPAALAQHRCGVKGVLLGKGRAHDGLAVGL